MPVTVAPRIVNHISSVRTITHVWLHRTSKQEVLVNKKFLAVAATLISFQQPSSRL